MRSQTAKLRYRLRDVADFDFLQGTHATHALDPAIAKRFGEDGSYFSWYDVEIEDRNEREYYECLLDASVVFRYPGVDHALARLEAHLDAAAADERPYDALLGFSQGAVLLTLLTALRLQPGAPPPSWRGNICVAGMPVRDDRFAPLFPPTAPPLALPCVIAQGTADPFYGWCRRLAHSYAAPLEVSYDEGHRFPHGKEANAELEAAIRRLLQQPAPERSAALATAPASAFTYCCLLYTSPSPRDS